MAKNAILSKFVKAIGPTDNWKGNCFAVSCLAIKAGLVKGTAVYGHWLGPRAPGSMFHRPGVPFVQHGWILLPDGDICDPTRWVFEDVKPYIYFGRNDFYDEGGGFFREAVSGKPPKPEPNERIFTLKVTPDLEMFLSNFSLNPKSIPISHLVWLANRSPRSLGPLASELYKILSDMDLDALVPYDNRKMVERLYP